MSRPTIAQTPRSPRGCCSSGPWAAGSACRLPSWPRSTAWSTVSAHSCPTSRPVPAACPPKHPCWTGAVSTRPASLLFPALCSEQFPVSPSLQRRGLFPPEERCHRGIANDNKCAAHRAEQCPGVLLVPAEGRRPGLCPRARSTQPRPVLRPQPLRKATCCWFISSRPPGRRVYRQAVSEPEEDFLLSTVAINILPGGEKILKSALQVFPGAVLSAGGLRAGRGDGAGAQAARRGEAKAPHVP